LLKDKTPCIMYESPCPSDTRYTVTERDKKVNETSSNPTPTASAVPDSAPTEQGKPTVQADSKLPQEALDRIFREARAADCDFVYVSRNHPHNRRLVVVAEDYDSAQIIRILVDASE
jgi:hypothetical protein